MTGSPFCAGWQESLSGIQNMGLKLFESVSLVHSVLLWDWAEFSSFKITRFGARVSSFFCFLVLALVDENSRENNQVHYVQS
jgi:hypothetical protein